MPLRFFSRVFGNPAGDPVLLKSRGVTLLRDTVQAYRCRTVSSSVHWKLVSDRFLWALLGGQGFMRSFANALMRYLPQ